MRILFYICLVSSLLITLPLDGITQSKSQITPIDVEAWAQCGPSDLGGFSTYSFQLLLGNPNAYPVSFDEVCMKFNHSEISSLYITELRLFSTVTGFILTAGWGGEPAGDMEIKEMKEMSVDGHRAITLDKKCFAFVRIFPVEPGQEPVRISIMLRQNNLDICSPLISVVPPMSRIPNYNLDRDQYGYHIKFFRKYQILSSSGVTDKTLLTSILKKAMTVSSDSILEEISPKNVTVSTYSTPDGGKKILHSFVEPWLYTFYSVSKGRFNIVVHSSQNIVRTDAEDQQEPIVPSKIEPNQIKIDSDVAILLAEHISGAKAVEGGFPKLRIRQVGSSVRPVWCIPYKRGSEWMAVCADTGEIVVSEKQNGNYKLAKDVIWNE